MKRVDIIINQSITEDLSDFLKEADMMEAYTRWTPVFGTGHSGPREGTSVWPETNSAILLFVEDDQISDLKIIIKSLKENYPDEGLKCFISQGPEEVL